MNPILYINWDIDPVIFSLGPVKIQYYGLIFVTGLALCYYIIGHIYKKEKIYTPDAMEKLFIYAVLGIFGGARLGHCLFYDFEHSCPEKFYHSVSCLGPSPSGTLVVRSV